MAVEGRMASRSGRRACNPWAVGGMDFRGCAAADARPMVRCPVHESRGRGTDGPVRRARGEGRRAHSSLVQRSRGRHDRRLKVDVGDAVPAGCKQRAELRGAASGVQQVRARRQARGDGPQCRGRIHVPFEAGARPPAVERAPVGRVGEVRHLQLDKNI
eukprot:scaffold7459_cov88-Isochrysis_galbana.AAC.1